MSGFEDRAVSQLVAGLSIGRPEVNSDTFSVGSLVDKVAPRQVSPPSISVFPWQYQPLTFRTHLQLNSTLTRR